MEKQISDSVNKFIFSLTQGIRMLDHPQYDNVVNFMKKNISKTSIKVEYFLELLKLSLIYGTLRDELMGQRFNISQKI